MRLRMHSPDHRAIRNFQSINIAVRIAEVGRLSITADGDCSLHGCRGFIHPPKTPARGIECVHSAIFTADEYFSSVRGRLAKGGGCSRKAECPLQFQILNGLSVEPAGAHGLIAAVGWVYSPSAPGGSVRWRVEITRAVSREGDYRRIRSCQIRRDCKSLRFG